MSKLAQIITTIKDQHFLLIRKNKFSQAISCKTMFVTKNIYFMDMQDELCLKRKNSYPNNQNWILSVSRTDTVKSGYTSSQFFYANLDVSELFKEELRSSLFLSWVNMSKTFWLKSAESLIWLFSMGSMPTHVLYQLCSSRNDTQSLFELENYHIEIVYSVKILWFSSWKLT